VQAGITERRALHVAASAGATPKGTALFVASTWPPAAGPHRRCRDPGCRSCRPSVSGASLSKMSPASSSARVLSKKGEVTRCIDGVLIFKQPQHSRRTRSNGSVALCLIHPQGGNRNQFVCLAIAAMVVSSFVRRWKKTGVSMTGSAVRFTTHRA